MATQAARVRQQLNRTLGELRTERCGHWNAEQIGVIEAALAAGGWVYRTAYQCRACGACFTETHSQTVPRSEADAVV